MFLKGLKRLSKRSNLIQKKTFKLIKLQNESTLERQNTCRKR